MNGKKKFDKSVKRKVKKIGPPEDAYQLLDDDFDQRLMDSMGERYIGTGEPLPVAIRIDVAHVIDDLAHAIGRNIAANTRAKEEDPADTWMPEYSEDVVKDLNEFADKIRIPISGIWAEFREYVAEYGEEKNKDKGISLEDVMGAVEAHYDSHDTAHEAIARALLSVLGDK